MEKVNPECVNMLMILLCYDMIKSLNVHAGNVLIPLLKQMMVR